LDTGATNFAITRRGAIKSGVTEAQLRADPTREVSGIGAMNANQPVHTFQSLAIVGETFRNVPLQLTDAWPLDGEILVGLTYLTPRRVWISYATGTLFIRAPKTLSSLQPPQLPELAAEPITPPLGMFPSTRCAAGQCGLVIPTIPLEGRCTVPRRG